MKIHLALDAMGGDFAPAEIVEGAKGAVENNPDIEITLVGELDKINTYLLKKTAKNGKNGENNNSGTIKVLASGKSIDMHEASAKAVKAKKDSSIVLGLDLVKIGKADAFISAGNTGAVMTAALFGLGRIKGIDRPAIVVTLPTAAKPVVLLDAGANPECKPKNLEQFAHMGSAFSEKLLGINNPSIGLLSIGAEKGKGDDLVKVSHDLLENASINFCGNIEGRDVSSGTTDVVVCDGFIGNVVLKTMEGLASVMFNELKKVIKSTTRTKVGGMLLASSLKKLQTRLNQDTYGGAHLLGVNGICIISHGSAKKTAIKNAVFLAKKSIEQGLVDKIKLEAHL